MRINKKFNYSSIMCSKVILLTILLAICSIGSARVQTRSMTAALNAAGINPVFPNVLDASQQSQLSQPSQQSQPFQPFKFVRGKEFPSQMQAPIFSKAPNLAQAQHLVRAPPLAQAPKLAPVPPLASVPRLPLNQLPLVQEFQTKPLTRSAYRKISDHVNQLKPLQEQLGQIEQTRPWEWSHETMTQREILKTQIRQIRSAGPNWLSLNDFYQTSFDMDDAVNFPTLPTLTRSMTTYGYGGVFSPSAGGESGFRSIEEYNQQRGYLPGFPDMNN